MAITFHQKGPEQLDITLYDVILDKEYTVQEFMDEILKDRVYDKGTFYFLTRTYYKGTVYFQKLPIEYEYAYGHLRQGYRMTEPYASKIIKRVMAEVRWSQIDYYIETGDDNGTEKETE